MNSSPLTENDIGLLAAILTPTVALVVFLLTQYLAQRRENLTRRRERFAQAYQAVIEYEEFTYVVRRRRASSPEDERIRISTEMRQTQEKIAFYQAWLVTESGHVALAYETLVQNLRRAAGTAVHDAWLTAPITTDAEMNIADIGSRLIVLKDFKRAYLDEVADHLSWMPRFLRRSVRGRTVAATVAVRAVGEG